MITMSDMDETFRKYLPDIPFGIAITIQNKIRMIHFKHKKIFYREILRALSKSTQLRVTDWTETFRNCLWYTRGLITCLYRHFEGLHNFQTQENIFKAKIIIVESKLKNLSSGFSVMIWVGRISVSSQQFGTGCRDTCVPYVSY